MTTSALLASLLAVAAWVTIPLQPVPVTLQVFIVVLAALLLSPLWALAATGVYVLLGAVGAPVFSGGQGGLGVLAGPTGGYILGFVLAASLGSLVRVVLERSGARQVLADAAAAGIVLLMIYLTGTAQLALVAHLTPAQAVAAGALPFIAIDVIKAAIAVAVAQAIRRALAR
jgi:biotin transport system substrate-specific component